MSTSTPSSSASIGKRALAVLILLVAAVILFKIVVAAVAAVAGIAVIILAICAVIWAMRVLQPQPVAGGAYISIALGFALGGGVVGKIKGSSFFLWFLISGAVPVIGLLAAVCYRSERDELRRQCPSCGRVCKLYDALCVRCGTELEFPERALASEATTPVVR